MGIMRTALIAFIWLVASIDVWCCQWLTASGELNPLARWIIVEYGVWTMVGVKVGFSDAASGRKYDSPPDGSLTMVHSNS